MSRKPSADYPDYMGPDGDRGGFFVRNPLNGKRQRFSREQESEARDAALVLAEFVRTERQARALDAGKPMIAGLVDRWIADKLRFMPWDEGTAKRHGYQLARIKKKLGDRLVVRTDGMFLEE